MAKEPEIEYLSGRVSNANEKGIKLEGHEAWMNVSQYASPKPVIPAKGTSVTVGLDSKGWIRSIEAGPTAPTPATQQTNGATPAAASYPINEEREQRITRLAVLNTATAILNSGGGAATLQEVIETAAVLLDWANGKRIVFDSPQAPAAAAPVAKPTGTAAKPATASPDVVLASAAMISYYLKQCEKLWSWDEERATDYCRSGHDNRRPDQLTVVEMSALIERLKPVAGQRPQAEPILETFDGSGKPIFSAAEGVPA